MNKIEEVYILNSTPQKLQLMLKHAIKAVDESIHAENVQITDAAS